MGSHSWVINNLSLIVAMGGLVIYALFVWWQTQVQKRQTKIMQESKWFPEGLFDANHQIIYFRGKRPWFPQFQASMNGRKSGWIDHYFWPGHKLEDVLNAKLHTDSEGDPVKIDWFTTIPEDIRGFFESFESGEHKAELEFQFKSWTGEVYLLEYELDLSVYGEEDDERRKARYPPLVVYIH